ncbi:MAG: 2-oxo acid dehydrogenase subunit E2 [Gemmataceae bacterium]|nr:2-oxo acid dehydrogenase subunit E2 [Gemmataceae bacterium]
MAIEILVPRLGWNMEEGIFHGWLKGDGEAVRAGEPIFTLEGDKAVQEIEATDSGILHITLDCPKNGDTVLVGALLGSILAPGESPSEPEALAKKSVSLANVTGSVVQVVPAAQPTTSTRRRPITPRARRAARERGVEWSGIEGTGRNGRIRERDVLAQATPSKPAFVSPRRRTIAERMLHSAQSTAAVTLNTTADATHLVSLRDQFKAASSPSPGFTDFFVKLAALVLRQHPQLNSRWQNEGIVLVPEINIGIAVDTDAGLLVPVIRDVAGLTLRQVAARSRDLAERARVRTLKPDEMQGGTFTVTNLGAFGIDAFTPIINFPECAILGIGRICKQPAVVGDQVVPRDMVTLSLTFDHRIVDGAPASRFLQSLVKAVENPAAWLVE